MLGRLLRVTDFKLSVQDNILFSRLSLKFSLNEVTDVIDEDSTMITIELKINNRCRYKRVTLLKETHKIIIAHGFNPFKLPSSNIETVCNDDYMAMITDMSRTIYLSHNVELIVDHIMIDNIPRIKIVIMTFDREMNGMCLQRRTDATMIDEDHYQGSIAYHGIIDKVDYFRHNDIVVILTYNDRYIRATDNSISVMYDGQSNTISNNTIDKNHPVMKSLMIVMDREHNR